MRRQPSNRLAKNKKSPRLLDAADQHQRARRQHRRARHFARQIARVDDAALAMEDCDLACFADLLAASHVSQRDDFETSHP